MAIRARPAELAAVERELSGDLGDADPVAAEYKTRAKNLLKGELKRRGITYAGLAEKLEAIGVSENQRNLNNKISRGGSTAAFLLKCLTAIEASSLCSSD